MENNFESMATDAYEILNKDKNGDLLILPKIDIDISVSRLHWKNVKEYLQIINRHPDHFMNYLKHEISNKEINWYSNSKSDGLIIHGKYQKKSEIIDIALKYVNYCVICSSCKKANSIINKENRYYEFMCLDCGMKKFF
jgi:translation initiation factor 2 beta subunit (eIF-2beta)/eIF-5